MLTQAEQRLAEIAKGRDAQTEARLDSKANKAEAESRLAETRADVTLLFTEVRKSRKSLAGNESEIRSGKQGPFGRSGRFSGNKGTPCGNAGNGRRA